MTVESFLAAPCDLWCDQDDEGEPVITPDSPTWRDWLKDVLVTMESEGEGFDGKRPNCEAGWDHYVGSALREHGVTMAQVVSHAFDREGETTYRLHAPGYRTREALKAFRSVAMSLSASTAGMDEAAQVADAAARVSRVAAITVREHLDHARAALLSMNPLPRLLNPEETPLGYEDAVLVEHYLDEVLLNRWRRTDIWVNRSP